MASTLTITATQNHSDANSALWCKFASGSYSSTTTYNIAANTLTSNQTLTLNVKYRNNSAGLDGAETTTTIYYKWAASAPAITFGSATPSALVSGNDITLTGTRINSSNNISFQYTTNDGTTWNDITPKTSSLSSNTLTVTWTVPEAHGATQTYKFRAKLAEATPIYSSASSAVSVYGKKTLHVKNREGWASMYLYAGNDNTGAWPGTTSTGSNSFSISRESSSQWYTVVITSANDQFLLNNGGSGAGNQTGNLSYSDYSNGSYYECYNHSGSTVDGRADGQLYNSSAPTAPTLTTGSAGSINLTGMTLNATSVGDGNDVISAYGFIYGTTEACSEGSVTASNLGAGTTFSKAITGLQPGTKYYFKAYATNPFGTTYGSVQNATTTAATLSLSGTADYNAGTMTITPSTNLTVGNDFSGSYYVCCECTTKPGGASPTITWNGTKLDISGVATPGDYTFNVKLKPTSNCSGDAYNNADEDITITMKAIPDRSSLTIGDAIYSGTYMNGAGTSENPYFIYVSNTSSYGKLNLTATLPAALLTGETLYYSVNGSERGTVSVDGTTASITMDLPDKTVGANRTAIIKFYSKLDGQTAPPVKMATETVYYTISADPVVTVAATYNGNPVAEQIPQSATITLSASVTNIPGEPTFTYSKGEGEYTSTTEYTLSEAGTTTMHAKTTYLGDWIGNLDITTYTAHSVTLTTRKTDMYGDVSATSTTRLFSNSGESYTAPTIEGYTFTGWSCSNSNVQVSTDGGSSWSSSAGAVATIKVKATSTGATLTANYAENKRIYFDNRYVQWDGEISVYLFSNDVWHSTNGVQPKSNKLESGTMTRIGESDIWYYEYSTVATIARVAFSQDEQLNNDYLYQTKASYRGDFSTCNPVFVAYTDRTDTKNSTEYYNNGYWRRYMPQYAPFSLYFTDGDNSGDKGKFVPEDPTKDGENFVLEVLRGATTTYHFNLPSSCGGAYGNNGEMTKDNCTNWTFEPTGGTVGNCRITTTASGTYIFRLSTANGQVKLSVEYPLSVGDYQIYYSDNTGNNNNYSNYIRKNTGSEAKDDIVSFFVKKNASPTYQVKRCTGFTDGNPDWENVGSAQSISISKDSVYVFTFRQPAGGASISLNGSPAYYSGDYYIRTDGAAGGWANYLSNPDNKMKHTDKPSALAAGYNYYYVKWIGDASGNSTANVKFVIANDYNNSLSQEMGNDPTGGSIEGKQNLTGKGANVRFTYNTSTNQMTRSYIGGSGHDDYYLVINGENLQTSGGASWTGRTKMTDQNDWIYTYELKATNNATIMIESHYNNKYVTILPSQKVLDSGDANYYDLKVIYDYKTNEVVAAYVPGTITTNLSVDVDIMFIRRAKDNYEDAPPTALSFGSGASITGAPKTLYGAIEFEKNYVRAEDSYAGLATQRPQRSTYWISFPFDVRVKDIFGLGDYGSTWILRQYRGDLRAQKGWFLDTSTFWEYILDDEFVLTAGTGYVLSIDCEAIQWPNNRTTQYLYFPSKEKVSTISSVLPSSSTTVAEHRCSITSPADRTVKDSHWNVIGVPGYAKAWGKMVSIGDGFKYFYSWNAASNTLSTTSVKKKQLEFLHSYMVQYYGTVNWTISEPASIVARRNKAGQAKEYELLLQILQNKEELDHTYISLVDEEDVSAAFDVNKDLVKMRNDRKTNIYSLIGDIQVAGNCLPVSEETTVVPLGVVIAADGEYTFTLPDGSGGIGVTLVDMQNGTQTNLAAGIDYTVSLSAGTYDSRFLLEISPVQNIPTGIDEVPSDQVPNTHTRKVMIDGVLYIVRDGKIYDARGMLIQ